MTETINLARIAVILLFAITFMVIGTTAPILFASNVPAEEVIEQHKFTAQDTTTNSDAHYICFDRTVNRETSGVVFSELYLLDKTDSRVEVGSETDERYFQDGRATIVTPMDLPENLEPGEYRYVLVVQAELADGRVTRDFTFESERFEITEGPATEPERPADC